MNSRSVWVPIFATVIFLSGCGDSGSKFEGKWSCDISGLGELAMSIRHNEGSDYIIDHSIIGKMSATYRDGSLTIPGGGALSIDKQSDKLIIPGTCEMSRVG